MDYKLIDDPLPTRRSTELGVLPWGCRFPAADVTDVIEVAGADRVLSGSGYPHPQRRGTPADSVGRLGSGHPVTTPSVTCANAAQLLGLSDGATTAGRSGLSSPATGVEESELAAGSSG
jgi:hypothetical protein